MAGVVVDGVDVCCMFATYWLVGCWFKKNLHVRVCTECVALAAQPLGALQGLQYFSATIAAGR